MHMQLYIRSKRTLVSYLRGPHQRYDSFFSRQQWSPHLRTHFCGQGVRMGNIR